ncbi:MAG: AAA family ATPase [Microbacteriaceae bacterium]
MVRIALAVPAKTEGRLVAEAVRRGHEVVARCSSAEQLISSLGRVAAEFAVVSAAPEYLTERLLHETDSRGVPVIAVVASEAERTYATTAGLYEMVDLTTGWEELESAFLGSSGRLGSAASRQSDPGRIVTVWGPAGAPGRTALAINVAAELAVSGATVALADIDTHGGSIAPALGLLDEAPGFAAACRLAGANGLTLQELERIGQAYRSPYGDFWVLTGIGRPSRWPELTAQRVASALRECRRWVDFTVVDTGFSLEDDDEISSDLFAPRRNAATITAIREADQVLAVGAADPVGLSRFLRAHADLIELVPTGQVTVIMNKIRSSVIGSNSTGQVVQTLARFGGITSPVLLPHDQAAFDAAILAGKTLPDVAAKSAARIAIAQLVGSRIRPDPPRLPRPSRAPGRSKRGRFAPAG